MALFRTRARTSGRTSGRALARVLARALGWSVAVALLPIGACATTPSADDPVVDDAGPASVPTETPPRGRPPASKPDSGPDVPEPEPDAGGDADVPDAAACETTPPSNVCGLVSQCGCESSQTCDIADFSGNVRCVAFGKAAAGSPCTTTSGCARGLTCVFGTCHAFCDVDGDPCANGSCMALSLSDDTPIPNYEVCSHPCDLRDPMACGGATPAGTGVCSTDGMGSTDCVAGGNLTEKEPCSAGGECGPALVCITLTIGNETTSECRRWCRVGEGDCGGASVCQGFSTKEIIDGVEYGICP